MWKTIVVIAAALLGVGGAAATVVLVAADSGDAPSAAPPTAGVEVEVTVGDTAPSETVSGAPTSEAAERASTATSSASANDVTSSTADVPATARPPASTSSTVSTTATRATTATTVPVPVGTVAPIAEQWEFADPATCPPNGHAAVIDRASQRSWLCADAAVTREMPMTSAQSQPDPGIYAVYAKDINASSTFTGRYSEMTHFVAFTHGKYRGARIAFHSVPTYPDGSYVQPLESVGTPERHGESSGCIRVLPDDAVAIWDWLAIGDPVLVVS